MLLGFGSENDAGCPIFRVLCERWDSTDPSTGAEARLLSGTIDAALKRRSSTVLRGFVTVGLCKSRFLPLGFHAATCVRDGLASAELVPFLLLARPWKSGPSRVASDRGNYHGL